MKRIRIRVILLVCWLIILGDIEQLFEPFSVDRFTITIALVLGMITLLAPLVVRIPLWMFLTVPLPALLLYKALTGELTDSRSLLQGLEEALLINLTTLIAYWVNNAISEFERSVSHITIGHQDKIPESNSFGKGLIYREVRRARNHQRPLTLMAIAVNEKSIKVVLDRMVQEAQFAMMKQYTLSDVAKTLCEKLEDADIVVQHRDHFLVVLPETRPQDIPNLIERLRLQISDQIGVELKIGSASLPMDGYTSEGLINKATLEMQADMEPEQVIEIEPVNLKHPAS